MASGKDKNKNKGKKKGKNERDKATRFSYRNVESIDSVFNYVATINKGLKTRQLAFGNDDEMIEMVLSDDVELRIEAETGKRKGSLQVTVLWDAPLASPKIAGLDQGVDRAGKAESDKKKDKKGKKVETDGKKSKKALKSEEKKSGKKQPKNKKNDKSSKLGMDVGAKADPAPTDKTDAKPAGSGKTKKKSLTGKPRPAVKKASSLARKKTAKKAAAKKAAEKKTARKKATAKKKVGKKAVTRKKVTRKAAARSATKPSATRSRKPAPKT